MTCAEFVELVTAYLEGALDSDTEQRFVEHIAVCEGCDRYVQQIHETVTQLGRLPTEESLSGAARDRLLAAFRGWERG
jgi:anti-sigma factor RsiW